MASILDELKRNFRQSDNALIQLIIVNISVYIILAVLQVVLTLFGVRDIFDFIYAQLSIPAQFKAFILKPWTAITYAFTHSMSGFFHILFNMLVLYWFGQLIKEYIGSKKLIALYFLGGIAGAVTYLIAFNLVPYYVDQAAFPGFGGMVGASASVYAISVAAATLLPNYRFHMLFIGPVKIKYFVLVFIFISFIGIIGTNSGGNLAHLGGAIMGFAYIKLLRSGVNLGKPIDDIGLFFKSIFKPKPKIRVSHKNTDVPKKSPNTSVDQAEIDSILDKISASGYESLTKEEKEKLFNASK